MRSALRTLRVLFVEDDHDDLELSMRELRGAGWELDWMHVETIDALRAALAEHAWDVVVCDYRLGSFEAPDALRIVREVDAEVPFIVVSGTVGEEIAAELMRLGAQDFVMKTNYQRLVPAILRELDQADTRRRNREAEEAVRSSEFRFRHIIDAALDAVIAMDAHGDVTEWNARAETMFGWTRAEVIGSQLADLIIPEEHRAGHRAGLRRYLETGEGPILGQRIELSAIRRDGQEFPVELTVTVLSGGGRPTFSAFVRDMTQKRDADAAIRESESRFRQISESISEAFWLATPDMTEFLYAGPAFEQITGWTAERMGSDPEGALELIHPDDRETVVAAFASAATGPFEVEYRVVRPDGVIRWINTRCTPVRDADDRVVRAAGVSTDVTERHESEAGLLSSIDALRRSEGERRALVQQLVRASEEERARLAGDVHDDSVQAMTAVGMRLETLKRRLVDQERVAEVDQLQTTVSDAVSRLRRLLFELRPPALDQHGVAAALRELLDRLEVRSRLEASGFEEPPDELRTILYRVAQESLANIRKHAGASNVTVELESDTQGWRVRVTDDGAGFAPEEAGADPTHMGLASMRERAEMGAGRCTITSAPGAGTTVEVFLPRHPA